MYQLLNDKSNSKTFENNVYQNFIGNVVIDFGKDSVSDKNFFDRMSEFANNIFCIAVTLYLARFSFYAHHTYSYLMINLVFVELICYRFFIPSDSQS